MEGSIRNTLVFISQFSPQLIVNTTVSLWLRICRGITVPNDAEIATTDNGGNSLRRPNDYGDSIRLDAAMVSTSGTALPEGDAAGTSAFT